MKVYLGADHRGFLLKEELKKHLSEKGFELEDKGAALQDPSDDYPDFAYPVAKAVAADSGARGILLCGSGMGMDVVANKVRGIRATVAYSPDSVVHARTHDDINIITLAADVLTPDEAKQMAELFLATELDPDERHARRLRKVAEVEAKEYGS